MDYTCEMVSNNCGIHCPEQGLEVPPEDGVDDALGLMRHNNEHNTPAYCEAEEVLAKQSTGQPMPSPLSGYRLRPVSNRKAHDMKENRKSLAENDSGATFVNWLLVRSEAMQKCNLC